MANGCIPRWMKLLQELQGKGLGLTTMKSVCLPWIVSLLLMTWTDPSSSLLLYTEIIKTNKNRKNKQKMGTSIILQRYYWNSNGEGQKEHETSTLAVMLPRLGSNHDHTELMTPRLSWITSPRHSNLYDPLSLATFSDNVNQHTLHFCKIH